MTGLQIPLKIDAPSIAHLPPHNRARAVLFAYLLPHSLYARILTPILHTSHENLSIWFRDRHSLNLSAAELARFLILLRGGPQPFAHGEQLAFCKKYGLNPFGFSRELRKARKLWRNLHLGPSFVLFGWES